jgi:hypothetical protein
MRLHPTLIPGLVLGVTPGVRLEGQPKGHRMGRG